MKTFDHGLASLGWAEKLSSVAVLSRTTAGDVSALQVLQGQEPGKRPL